MLSNQDQTERASVDVDKSTRELQQRLAALSKAPAFAKMQHAGLVSAAFFELLQHQARFNACAIAELAELRRAVAELQLVARGGMRGEKIEHLVDAHG